MPEIYESELNIRIADILSKSFELDCRPERPGHRARPDIKCYHNGLLIIIEASYSESDAEMDARNRIEEGLVDIALALHYIERYSDLSTAELERELKNSTFDVRIIASKELEGLERFMANKIKVAEPKGGWFRGIRLEHIADLIKNAAGYMMEENEVRQEVENVKQDIDRFVKVANSIAGSDSLREKIASVLYKLYGFSVAEARDSEVVFGQAALSILLSTVFYERLRHVHGLEPVEAYLAQKGNIEGLKAAFEGMLKIDYRPALKLAMDILNVTPPALGGEVKKLVERAERISEMTGLLARDFAGRVYHEITGDIAVRKGFATFYTEVPAAYLLTSLALRTALNTNHIDSLSKEEAEELVKRVTELKVADFACGSGTLLTASLYNAARLAKVLCFRHNIECPKDEKGHPKIEKELVEKGIYGLDALRYAAQITAINIALMLPYPDITRENIAAVYLGYVPAGEYRGAWLGSLELLQERGKKSVEGLYQYYELGAEDVVKGVSVAGEEGKVELPDTYDVIVMNPPFTRPTGRTGKKYKARDKGFLGFITDEELRSKVKERYESIQKRINAQLKEIAEKLFDEERASLSELSQLLSPRKLKELEKSKIKQVEVRQYQNIAPAGEGLLFLYMSYKFVKPDGVIAFVLPRNLLSGTSWFYARALLASKFHLKYVIVSSDSKSGYNFSEGTGLSETLVIAQRVNSHRQDEETIFINLLAKPKTSLESLLLSERILSEASKGKEGFFELPTGGASYIIKKVNRAELLKNIDNLNRFVAFPESNVVEFGLRLVESGELGVLGMRVPLIRLGNLLKSLGIDAHQFHNLFEPVKAKTSYQIVYGGEEDVRTRIYAEPNGYASLKNGIESEKVFEKFSGRVLVPDRIWVDTAHVIALYSSAPVLSNVFYAVKLNDVSEEAEKALVYWLNTSWGLLSVLLNREETRGGWVSLKMSQWRLLPVLNLLDLDQGTLKRIAEAFDEISLQTPRRLPEQFSENPEKVDPVRLELDLKFLKALNPSLDETNAKAELYKIYGRLSVMFSNWIGQDYKSV